MRRIKGKLIILIVAMTLLGTVQIVTADSDSKGDIYHHKVSTDGITWIYEKSTVEKDDVDIKEVSYEVSGNNLVITFEVYGEIQTTTKHSYILFFNTTDATYIFTWTNMGNAIGYDWDYYNDMDSFDPTEVLDHMKVGELTKDGGTLTGTIELMGSSEPTHLWGYATESIVDYTEDIDLTAVEWYGDWWPDIYSPWYGIIDDDDTGGDDTGGDDTGGDDTGGDDTGGDGTGGSTTDENGSPGFELIALIVGFALLIFVFRKKK
jgi:hypothetical protein